MNVAPFNPQGATVTFTSAATAPTPVQAVSSTGAASNYLISNTGTTTVFLGVGVTAALATTNSATVTSSGNAIPILAGTTQTLTFVANSYFTGTSTASCVVYVTPGDGA